MKPQAQRSTRLAVSATSTYAVAVAAVLVAAGLRWTLIPFLGYEAPYITFFAAVVCAAWYGGLRPGILAVVLSWFLAEYLFLDPIHTFWITRAGVVSGIVFAAVAMSCVLLSGSLHRTRARAMEAEHQLRDALASTADDFLAVDREWRITFVNPHAVSSLGGTSTRLVGKGLWKAFPGILGTDLEDTCRAVMSDRVSRRIEASGPVSGRLLDMSVYPTATGIAVHGRDIGALRQAEKSALFIADASRLLAQTLDYDETMNQVAELAVPRLADWCFIDLVGADGGFRPSVIRCVAEEMLWVRDELMTRYFPDPESPHPVQQAFRTRRPELVPRVTEAWLQARSRDPRHLELLRLVRMRSVLAIPLVVRNQVLGVLTLVSAESDREYGPTDLQNAEALAIHIGFAISNSRLYYEAQLELHERTQAELALRESEGRFRTLVTATGAMVWRLAPDGRAIEEPAGWEQVTGQPYDDLRNEPLGWFSRVHPGDLPRVQALWAQAQSAKRMVDVEFRLRRRDGTYRRMHTVGVPLLNEEGDISEWIGTTIDVHEHREAEEQLHRAQRTETVGRLAGGVAHETNNQMMVILSFVEFLLRGANLTEEQRGDLHHLAEAAERVSALTRQLLALSRRQLLDTRVLDLDSVLMEAESVLRRTLGPAIRLSVQLEAGPKWVMADRTQLVQILVNLGINARDAIQGSGELTISSRRADRGPPGGRLGTPWTDTGVALFSVADTGTGIDPRTIGRIFEPFFSTKPAGQGTGLGLSVVEGIVSQSGGDVWVESKPGYGTVVTIGFPLTRAPGPEASVRPGPATHGGTETILVVDDEEQVRRLLVRGLQLGDYRVVEASGGAEAVAVLEHEPGRVQLVVTDIAMPTMSGVELGRRIQARWPHLPVIFVSGHPYEVVAYDQSISQGRFLQKPFKVDTLLGMVRSALDEAPPVFTSPA